MKPIKRQIESLRPVKPRPSVWAVPNVTYAREPDGVRGEVDTITVYLVGAECPFRCAMCDLWQYTTLENTPVGAIPHQLSQVLKIEPRGQRRWLKLYNASNFFDPRSIPKEDFDAIAKLCSPFERVIVENHPRFCDDRMKAFADALDGQLEVAMGLETIHPIAMAAMNKGMTLEDFDLGVEKCHSLDIDVRVFALFHPPGISKADSNAWTWKTVAYALDRSVRHVSIIPMRTGNGWIDQLIENGEYQLPTISMIRDLFCEFHDSGIQVPDGSVIEFDLWDSDHWQGGCNRCRDLLKTHIAQCNRDQKLLSLNETKIDCECII